MHERNEDEEEHNDNEVYKMIVTLLRLWLI